MCLKTNTHTHTHPQTVVCAEYVTLYAHVYMWLNTDVACARHVSEQQNGHIDLRMSAAVPCHRLSSGKGSVFFFFIQATSKNLYILDVE